MSSMLLRFLKWSCATPQRSPLTLPAKQVAASGPFAALNGWSSWLMTVPHPRYIMVPLGQDSECYPVSGIGEVAAKNKTPEDEDAAVLSAVHQLVRYPRGQCEKRTHYCTCFSPEISKAGLSLNNLPFCRNMATIHGF